jgi:hypothetical protein
MYLEENKDLENKMTIRNMVINRVFEYKIIQLVYQVTHLSSWNNELQYFRELVEYYELKNVEYVKSSSFMFSIK